MRTLTLGSSLALATVLALTAHPVRADILPVLTDLILRIDDDNDDERWHRRSHHRRWIEDDDDNRHGSRYQRFYRHGVGDDDD